MDIQTSLAIAGIAATILLGIWAIAITVRYNRSVEITHALDLGISLTNDISQNFPELKVLLRDQPVSESLVLLKGYFINTGKQDISREMVEQRLALRLPGGFEWTDCKVVKCSSALRAKAGLGVKTEAWFETGLWKSREYFKYEALAKVPVVKAGPDGVPDYSPASRLIWATTFSHRIAGLKDILETRIPVPARVKTPAGLFGLRFPASFVLPPYRSLALPLAWVSLIVGVVLSLGIGPEKALGLRVTIDGQERVVSAHVDGDKVLLTERSGFSREYTISELEKLPDKRPEVVPYSRRGIKINVTALLCLAAIPFIVVAKKLVRERRLLSMIAEKGESRDLPSSGAPS